ncbi:MAG: L-threonylcarbamoyladenylate synthase [Patescibacteria group bacterium]
MISAAVNYRSITKKAKKTLIKGGIGVIPTDTIYGIVGSVLSLAAVKRIYRLRRRNPKKPMIILIGSLAQLRLFGIYVSLRDKKIIKRLWPGKVSIVFPCKRKNLSHLHRGTGTLAFRLPARKNLRDLLIGVGPLVAPSANIEGKPPANTTGEARKYFGNKVDFYIDAGKLISPPSTLVTIKNGKIIVLRKGAVNIY